MMTQVIDGLINGRRVIGAEVPYMNVFYADNYCPTTTIAFSVTILFAWNARRLGYWNCMPRLLKFLASSCTISRFHKF